MREIKFRALDMSSKVIHKDVEFIRSGTCSNDWIVFKSDIQTLESNNVLENPYFQEQIKIMQYTGLNDKNGIEIYEHMELDNNFEVSFKDGSYVLINISNGDIILLYDYLKDKNGQVTVTKEYTAKVLFLNMKEKHNHIYEIPELIEDTK